MHPKRTHKRKSLPVFAQALWLLCAPLPCGAAPAAVPVEIDADHLLVEEQNNRAVYSGHVELRQGDLRVSADKVTVSGGAKSMQKITASGSPVRLQQLDRRGEGAELVYDPKNQIVTLTGGARIWRNRDEVSGDRVIYDLKLQRTEVNSLEKRRVKSVFYPKAAAAPATGPSTTP